MAASFSGRRRWSRDRLAPDLGPALLVTHSCQLGDTQLSAISAGAAQTTKLQCSPAPGLRQHSHYDDSHANGEIAACSGLGTRLVPTLMLGEFPRPTFAAGRTAADDFVKRWIRVEGPEGILVSFARSTRPWDHLADSYPRA